MANIKFGTDGFRGIIAKDFTFDNVELILYGIIKYIHQNNQKKQVLIGYDPRFMADKFAEFSANLLIKYGIEVLLSDKILPTPVLAYNAKKYQSCAIMFTASHNPYEYLGLKFIPDYAGPANKEITDKLMENINLIENNFSEINKYEDKNTKNITVIDFSKDYFEHLNKIIDFEKIKNANINIAYDAHYSAGIGHVDKLFEIKNIKFENLCDKYDVKFGGDLPEPKLPHIRTLQEFVKQNSATIGFSNDGDADRFGVINELGEYVSPNEIICILAKHLILNKKITGKIATTVGASSCINLMAKKLNTETVITPVGFKWLAQAMLNDDILIAGEESGGISIKNHIPEKDGILAIMLILEAISYFQKPLYILQKEIKEELGLNFINSRIDKKLSDRNEIENIINKFDKMTEIAGFKVIDKLKIDGLKIFLENNSWILIRPSGTEPLLRMYFETTDINNLKMIENELKNI